MNKKILASVIIVVVLLSVSGLLVYNQFSSLQNQISELQAQNSQLIDQNVTSQARIRELELQISELEVQVREQQALLEDFADEFARLRNPQVEITAFSWDSGFYPIVGVTLVHPANVTVQNQDDFAVFGLTLSFGLVDKRTGAQIGSSVNATIDRINAGESVKVRSGALTTIGTSLNGAVYVVTLYLGSTVLDEWKQVLAS